MLIGIGISVLIGTNLLAAAILCKWVNNEDVKDIPTQEYDEFTRQQVESFEKDHKSVGLIPAP